jgi:hypothetical protein
VTEAATFKATVFSREVDMGVISVPPCFKKPSMMVMSRMARHRITSQDQHARGEKDD